MNLRHDPTRAADTATNGELVLQHRAGDRAAFAALYRRHYGLVLGVLREMGASGADAEDGCQEAFLIALERFDQLENPAEFTAWLITVVTHQSWHLSARPQQKTGDRSSRSLDEAVQNIDSVLSRDWTPESEVLFREMQGQVQECLREAPAALRKPMGMLVDGSTSTQIASALGDDFREGLRLVKTARKVLRAELDHPIPNHSPLVVIPPSTTTVEMAATIRQLPRRQQQVMTLKTASLTNFEIATELKTSVNNVRVNCHHAEKRLAALFGVSVSTVHTAIQIMAIANLTLVF